MSFDFKDTKNLREKSVKERQGLSFQVNGPDKTTRDVATSVSDQGGSAPVSVNVHRRKKALKNL